MIGAIQAVAAPGWAPLLFDTMRQFSERADGQQLWMTLAVAGFVLGILPAILALVTSFTRILLVLTFLRHALGVGELPPDRILAALAFFLTLHAMSPVMDEMGEKALRPWLEGKATAAQAVELGVAPLRRFMVAEARRADVMLFTRMAQGARPGSSDEVPLTALIPAFVLSELRAAFQIGIVLYLPFLVVDLIIATTVTSLGLAGINPVTLAVPFKLLVFVLADGWHLVVSSLVRSVHG